jgi:hypothetical protein
MMSWSFQSARPIGPAGGNIQPLRLGRSSHQMYDVFAPGTARHGIVDAMVTLRGELSQSAGVHINFSRAEDLI